MSSCLKLSGLFINELYFSVIFHFSDIFDAMFLVKHNIGEIVIQQGKTIQKNILDDQMPGV